MLTKLFAITAVGVTIASIWGAYTQQSAFHLRQERQTHYRPRRRTYLYGRYRRGIWVPIPIRTNSNEFRGGGPGSGK